MDTPLTDWFDWSADLAPPLGHVRVRFRTGHELWGDSKEFRWTDYSSPSDIVQYRYEPLPEGEKEPAFWTEYWPGYAIPPADAMVYARLSNQQRWLGHVSRFDWGIYNDKFGYSQYGLKVTAYRLV